jgi:YesN/AraC family two-component response regulator
MTESEKRRILIVDDEPAVLSSLARSLRHDFTVHTATSVDVALRLLVEHDISVLLTDQRMPEMTGVELLAAAQEVAPQTVGIILTGYADWKVRCWPWSAATRSCSAQRRKWG